jgi:hypothetical protein
MMKKLISLKDILNEFITFICLKLHPLFVIVVVFPEVYMQTTNCYFLSTIGNVPRTPYPVPISLEI